MKVAFSSAAENDLEEIGDYTARDNPRRAVTFIADIRKRCTDIAAAPEATPLRPDIMAEARVVVFGHYLIFYRVVARHIRIERVLHSGATCSPCSTASHKKGRRRRRPSDP